MKNLKIRFSIAAAILLSLVTFYSASATEKENPEGFIYRAKAAFSSGNVITNTQLLVRVQILDNSETGTITYTEEQLVTTDEKGIFSLQIGTGKNTNGSFESINWKNPQFMKVEINVAGTLKFYDAGTYRLPSKSQLYL